MKKNNHNIRFRIPKIIHQQMLEDLNRKHPFAYERVGFLFTTSKKLDANTTIILAKEYCPVDDLDYIKDKSVGAKIGTDAIRKSMQKLFNQKGGCFHVHQHSHSGKPHPSLIDKKSLPAIADSFSNIAKDQANGILILSDDSFYSSILLPNKNNLTSPQIISSVGFPMKFAFEDTGLSIDNKIYDRQSFLGASSQVSFDKIKVGIVGYGGGGSHIGQQLAHLGVKNIVIFDDDYVEDTNLNRLVGAWFTDVKKKTLKGSIAYRVIKKILPTANIQSVNKKWQECPEMLQSCDVVFGNVDSFSERDQLEAECRRYLIPLIDIGMDVFEIEEINAYSMSGQVILSMPGCPCMRCFGFLTDDKLSKEAAKYGKVGGRPQVVWPNGVLASTAIGVFVDLVTGWTRSNTDSVYLEYDGCAGSLNPHIRLKFADKICSHFPISQIGPPKFLNI